MNSCLLQQAKYNKRSRPRPYKTGQPSVSDCLPLSLNSIHRRAGQPAIIQRVYTEYVSFAEPLHNYVYYTTVGKARFIRRSPRFLGGLDNLHLFGRLIGLF